MPPQTRLLNYLPPRSDYLKGKVLSRATFRKVVLERDGHTCQQCRNTISDPFRRRTPRNEAHHVIAVTHGGRNVLQNGITLCTFCHQYADEMYLRHGIDFYTLIFTKTKKQRIKEVHDLIKNTYRRYLEKLSLVR